MPTPEDPVVETIAKIAEAVVQVEQVPNGFVQFMDDIEHFINDLDSFFSKITF